MVTADAGRAVAAPPAARSVRSRPALAAGLLATCLLLLLACAASLALGAESLPSGTVLTALLDYDATDRDQLIVRHLRVPRTFAGLLVGVALGLAGAVMQGIARNPLADPGILGINAGAGLFVVLGIGWFGLTSFSGYVWCGFVGALLAAVLVYGISALGREGATPVKLALAGATTTAALGSMTSALVLSDTDTFDQYRFWQVGTLSRSAETVEQAAPFIVLGLLAALGCGRYLNALALGEDVARALGQRVGLVRAACALVVVLLCGAATALCGPIVFVGLVVPHIVRAFTGSDYRWILPYSAVLAPCLLLVADVIGRLLAPPSEVQVGIVTAVLGAIPFVLLVRGRKQAEL
ncbi:FecCD family ABC transporter permease [Streptomyces johnsoniae]|uniref:Iron chelate uptake ABC transporter family permease subunit n=1 Tax=Streptomyces johnsoniae TaxID=3075532 RepID=A0ABU2SC87_9ACTN|nr:iron chelate uptake ABC transporter family permease subunit [Streptomyces sp. DSM 41886]MDT0446576.1 iron chelate uptake ABC transporter family permease subunit [Streptomyces sp. DSM 41886]